jgi:NADH:ubiquinone oxidoreductase subunit E
MKITVCIGSSCHIKGSRLIVEQLQSLIAENNLRDKVELSGKFCMGKCAAGVSVTVDDVHHSLQPENTAAFFRKNVLERISESTYRAAETQDIKPPNTGKP